MIEKLRIVIDTNILLVSVSPKSRLHWIFKSLLEEKYILCVTTDMLAEYAEVIERHMGHIASESALGILENLENIEYITSYFQFDLLQDKDDNKFVDCAIAANAHFLVTHDGDFNILKSIEFPKVEIINTDEFEIILSKL